MVDDDFKVKNSTPDTMGACREAVIKSSGRQGKEVAGKKNRMREMLVQMLMQNKR